jgi:hypothetical protein
MFTFKYIMGLIGKMIQAVLATIGGAFTLKKAVDAAIKHFEWSLVIDSTLWIWITSLSAALYCIVLIILSLKLSQTAKIYGTDARVTIRVGNMFNSKNASYLITSNQTFDTDPEVITSSCLQGRVTQQYFDGSAELLDGKLEQALQGRKYSLLSSLDKSYGKLNEYPFGTTARVEQNGKKFYFLAITKMNAAGVSETSREKIKGVLPDVWESIHDYATGGEEKFVCPVLGAGESRVAAESEALIRDIVRTVVPCLKTNQFCRSFTIVIHWKAFLRNKPNIVQLGEFLRQECRFS